MADSVADAPTRAVKQYTAGTHRCVSPEETLARVEPWMPAMGITKDLSGNITNNRQDALLTGVNVGVEINR